jgi:hypothetical protein
MFDLFLVVSDKKQAVGYNSVELPESKIHIINVLDYHNKC